MTDRIEKDGEAKAPDTVAERPRPLDDSEVEHLVGGTGSGNNENNSTANPYAVGFGTMY